MRKQSRITSDRGGGSGNSQCECVNLNMLMASHTFAVLNSNHVNCELPDLNTDFYFEMLISFLS